MTDLCRLAAQQWQANSSFEQAFLQGYGNDPRDLEQWRIITLHEAIGTAVWAHQIGGERFEKQGHSMVDEALNLF